MAFILGLSDVSDGPNYDELLEQNERLRFGAARRRERSFSKWNAIQTISWEAETATEEGKTLTVPGGNARKQWTTTVC